MICENVHFQIVLYENNHTHRRKITTFFFSLIEKFIVVIQS
jgi:hypothetical protein